MGLILEVDGDYIDAYILLAMCRMRNVTAGKTCTA